MSTSTAEQTTGESDPFAVFGSGGDAGVTAPDFSTMKKGELQKWLKTQIEQGHVEGDIGTPILTLKLADMRTKIKALFPKEGDLTAPDVTGFDPNDLIHQTVASVQALAVESDAVAKILSLQDEAEFNFFQIGGVFSQIRAQGWMGEYESFGDFTEGTFNIKKRKAETLIQIYDALVGCGAAWSEAKDIGWSKLGVIATVLTPENYLEWFTTAGESTQAGLVQTVKDAKAAAHGTDKQATPDASSTAVKKKTFTLHEDQLENVDTAIQKAKEDFGTEHDNVALDAMATSFLSEGVTKVAAPAPTDTEEEEEVDAEATLTELFEAIRAEESLSLAEGLEMIAECFAEAYPDVELTFETPDEIDSSDE